MLMSTNWLIRTFDIGLAINYFKDGDKCDGDDKPNETKG